MDPNDQNGQNPGTPQDDGGMGGVQTPAPEPTSAPEPTPAPEPTSAPEPTPEPASVPEAPAGGMGEVPPPPPAIDGQGDNSSVPGSDSNPAA